MTTSLVCGFECFIHSLGAGDDDAKHWSVIGSQSGTPAIVSSPSRNGGKTMHFKSGAGGAIAYFFHKPPSSGDAYFRGYFRLPDVTPSGTVEVWATIASGYVALIIDAAGLLQLKCISAGSTVSTVNNVSLLPDTWYGVEIETEAGVGAKWRVWTEAGGWTTSESVARAGTTTGSSVLIGFGTGVGEADWSMYWADVRFARSASGGDIYDDTGTNGKDGHVTRLSPTSDGTHSFSTTGDFLDAAGDIAEADTDVWESLDTEDMEASTDYVEAAAGATTAEYVEVHFADEATADDPQVVSVVTVYDRASGSGTPPDVEISDNGTNWLTLDSPGSITAASPMFAQQSLDLAPSGAAWTRALVNSLRVRIYGNAASGARVEAIALEIEWATLGPPENAGSGAITAPAATLSGNGILQPNGIGAITAPAATLSGNGLETIDAAAGAITAPAATLSGTGRLEPNGTGAIIAPAARLSGTGILQPAATGGITAPAARLSGTGTAGGESIPSLGTRPRKHARPQPQHANGVGHIAAPSATLSGRGGAFGDDVVDILLLGEL